MINSFFSGSQTPQRSIFRQLSWLIHLAVATHLAVTSVSAQSAILRQFIASREPGIGFVEAMPLKDHNEQNTTVTLVTPSAEPNVILPQNIQTVAIFVHGYNTPPQQALLNAYHLRRNILSANVALRHAKVIDARDDSVAFVAFVWRGHFGVLGFEAADRSASASSRSLVQLIKALIHMSPTSKKIIIAHSLGSRVVLEATRDFLISVLDLTL
jgi:esterase/lipase superfamily enzyme